jgi:KDO2-lipid IV(A) lauroyltransferase
VTASSSAAPLPPPIAASLPRTSRAHWLNRAPFFRLATAVARATPRGGRLRLASAVGGTLAHACRREAEVVRANLARVTPALPARELHLQVRDLFRHFAMCFADLVTTNRRVDATTLSGGEHGREHVDGLLESGFIVLTAHVGNWELAGRLLVGRSQGRPLHVVMAPEADPRVEGLLRHGGPTRIVTLRAPADAIPLVAALRRGEIVGMQGDRPLGQRGDMPVPFFGAPALFPLGPFVLARAAGVPVLPAYCVLRDDRRYTVLLQPPIHVQRDEEDAALAQWVDGLAAVIARHPTQWFSFVDPWEPARAC